MEARQGFSFQQSEPDDHGMDWQTAGIMISK